MNKKQIARMALQSLTRLRQGVNPFDTKKLCQFFEDQKVYAKCLQLLNLPEGYSNKYLVLFQRIYRSGV